MNYKLAKQLKDAGFPQKQSGEYIDPREDVIFSGDWNDFNTEDCVSLPTLSELIEACGERFLQISKNPELSERKWGAFSFKNSDSETKVGLGDTPEKAVARLWLELNKEL